MTDLVALAAALGPEISRLRRDFHRHPELSWQETRTAGVVRARLEALGLRVTAPGGMTGLWADLDAPGAGERLLFRADMDALAMDEEATPGKGDFLSANPGAAHCCGHDAHLAALLAAASLLATGAARPRRSVRFLFQHAEEQHPGGAAELIQAGCLEGVDQVFGAHVQPALPAGAFGLLEGPAMAASDEVRIRVVGRGGHAATPHLLRDPIVAAAGVVSALQLLAARRASPLEPFVCTVATIRGGTGTHNVVPDAVELMGTVRTLDSRTWEEAPRWVEEAAGGAAAAAGCRAEVQYRRGYPVLRNHPEAVARGREAVTSLFGQAGLVPAAHPLMGGEDFARYAEQRPGCFAFFGPGAPPGAAFAPLHSTRFDLDEGSLHRLAAWFAALAAR